MPTPDHKQALTEFLHQDANWDLQNLKRKGLERIAGQNSRRFIKNNMAGRFAAAGFRIIHGGQIIMDQ